ncbi:cancer/testis antigen 2 [Sapajus apella]|uniref:Cancer/testis antigen 2 n=1 Tax=Sapajus apella TaxID=9515 RepID=A0A6J3GU37_SAPAP|nr:cancer/testis antigen 2 [Sapajus apella]
MQAGDQAAGGAAGDADGPGGPGPKHGQLFRSVHELVRAPQGSGAARASGPEGGDPQGPRGGAASAQNGSCPSGARGSDSHLLQFHITMPFLSPMEAELARRILARDAAPLPRPGEVRKDFTVSGNLLVIRLAAADPRQLQVSIGSCLQQLSLLMWIMQSFVPVFLALLSSGQRG